MPMVIDPIAEIECEAIVRGIDVAPNGQWMAWGGDDGVVRILDVTGAPTALEPFNVDDAVTQIRIASGDVIVVGTHTSDLHGHERLGGHRWTHAIGGGCDHLKHIAETVSPVSASGTRLQRLFPFESRT